MKTLDQKTYENLVAELQEYAKKFDDLSREELNRIKEIAKMKDKKISFQAKTMLKYKKFGKKQ